MKIDYSTNANLLPHQGDPPRTHSDASTSASGNSATITSSMPVALSALGAHVRAVAASISSDIDIAHVAAVKAALDNGTYTIDSRRIADGMLRSAGEVMKRASAS